MLHVTAHIYKQYVNQNYQLWFQVGLCACGNLDQVLIMVGATQRLNLDQAKPI